MALMDDINALPTTVGDGNTGHLNNHQVIHAALKDHEQRLGARHLIGTGSPEGRITATIGTQYTDQAATNGAIRWTKASGTGATGWRVEYGDTGWRDVTSLMPEQPVGGALRVRRVPTTLYLQTSWLDTGADGFTVELGNQWSPAANSGGELVDSDGVSAGFFRFTFSGRLVVTKSTSSRLDGVVFLLPSNTWPATYIGTPV